jgi:hypothetical protein
MQIPNSIPQGEAHPAEVLLTLVYPENGSEI